jgi:serine/threonine protein kinase
VSRNDRAVALKVLQQDRGQHELDIMKRITVMAESSGLVGGRHVMRLLDSFEHVSESGTHLCLVLELMWQDALRFLDALRDELQIAEVKRMAQQILRGVKFLHTCGIMHNGNTKITFPAFELMIDLHPMNFLVSFETQNMSVEQFLAMSSPVDA